MTKLILNFCCHGNQNTLNIMENYHKKDFLVILFNTFQQNFTKNFSWAFSIKFKNFVQKTYPLIVVMETKRVIIFK